MLGAWLIEASAVPAAGRLPRDPRLLWAAFGLVGILLLGAVVIWWAGRWRKRAHQPDPVAGDPLTDFQQLYERGQLSREEFERIRTRLNQPRQQDLDVPDASPKEPPTTNP
jgi:hypothetical protein